MEKLNKPKLEFSVIDKVSTIFGIIISIFSNYVFDLKTAIIVFLTTLLIILTYSLYKYYKDINLFYAEYEKLYDKFYILEKRYNARVEEIKNNELLIAEYEKLIENLNLFIIASLTKNSSTETEQLKNMQQFLFLSTEHLSKLKGENTSGRKI